MGTRTVAEFRKEREELNELLLAAAPLEMKRFFTLDGQVYQEGALSTKAKEMLGLVASLVLRCDDCVTYHLIRCREEGVGKEELMEVLSIGLLVGGSITIPHLRRAMAAYAELEGD